MIQLALAYLITGIFAVLGVYAVARACTPNKWMKKPMSDNDHGNMFASGVVLLGMALFMAYWWSL